MEGRLGLIQVDGGDGDSLLGCQVDFVCGLKYFFICCLGELEIAYMSPNIYRKFVTPEGKDGSRTAAAGELDGLLTHVIDDLEAELRG